MTTSTPGDSPSDRPTDPIRVQVTVNGEPVTLDVKVARQFEPPILPESDLRSREDCWCTCTSPSAGLGTGIGGY
ncbi:hypothetical protein [Raineyella fluvialis]|uniref:Uncharacterized protein n=1 Tax=Raineyella fluvialis TaxID=2662261 RepID=A0A5Q2FAD7_9ACTN|nr:hypothetical protein [Raineyella fluvialis]QGF23769.1 hypothetical protein Rai3103_08885 [Raineyella fluvialis]